jgi:hypothetical protein
LLWERLQPFWEDHMIGYAALIERDTHAEAGYVPDRL